MTQSYTGFFLPLNPKEPLEKISINPNSENLENLIRGKKIQVLTDEDNSSVLLLERTS